MTDEEFARGFLARRGMIVKKNDDIWVVHDSGA